MTKLEGIIADVEGDYGVTIEDWPTDILCQHEGCIHSECDCWDAFKAAVEGIAEAMIRPQPVAIRQWAPVWAGQRG